MWELIRANKRRSTMLVVVMLGLLLAVGWIIGAVVTPWISVEMQSDFTRTHAPVPVDPMGGVIGMSIAFGIWFVQALVSYYFGGRILLAVSGARRVSKQDAPQLYNVVEEMTIAAQLPKVPDVYIMDDPGLNAFATGRDPMHSAVAVTSGLLGRMNRDQLQGVIAHEVSHIVHRDVLYMTMVGIMLGTIVLLCEAFFQVMRGIMNGSRYSSRSRSKGNGGMVVVLVLLVVALLLYLIAPLVAQMIYFAISRRREYLADAGAAIFTRYPEGLASALEALERDHQPLTRASRATAPLYIVNPLAGKMSLLMSSHPPTGERVRVLRGLAGLSKESGQVSYAQYEQAYEKTQGKRRAIMPKGALGLAAAPLREGTASAEAQAAPEPESEARQRRREAGDLVRSLNQFTFLPCACGVRVKLPPGYARESVRCPRCGTELSVKTAQPLSPVLPPDGVPVAIAKDAPLEHTRTGTGWESVRCLCGAVKNIAPSFAAPETSCNRCGRKILLR